MGIWIPLETTLPDELVEIRCLANAFQVRRAIGGRLTVTNQRVVFTPNRLDRISGGRRLVLDRSDISQVRLNPPGPQAARERGLNTMLNAQVEIEHRGVSTAFVVFDYSDQLIRALAGPILPPSR